MGDPLPQPSTRHKVPRHTSIDKHTTNDIGESLYNLLHKFFIETKIFKHFQKLKLILSYVFCKSSFMCIN